MRRAWYYCLGVGIAWSVTLPWASAQQQQQPREQAQQSLTVRGKVVRMESPDRFIVRTAENKEITFYTNPQTKYTIDGRAARYADLRVGAEINAAYTTRDERHYVSTVTVGQLAADPPREQEPGERERTTVRGKIVKVERDHLVLMTDKNKEVTLYTTPQARFTINGKAGRWADLRVGTEIQAAYTIREERHYIDTVTVGAVTTEAPPAEGTPLQGTVVRVIGDDQVIVKTQDNKEVIIYVQPQTKYLLDEQPARLTDLRTGSDIRIQYDERDRRRIARSIFWRRK